MLPRPFHYLQPETLHGALAALGQRGDDAMPYAGGTELLLILKMRLSEYDYLVDLKRIPELRAIRLTQNHLVIGSMVTHGVIARDPDIHREVPALAELCGTIANPRVRASGTIGGNLCFAEPTADPPTLLAALDAKLYLASVRGERCVSAGSFVKGPLETARADDEILLRIEIPRGRQTVRYVRQLNGHRSLVGAAAFVPRQMDVRPQVWLGCVAQRPVALPNTEAIIMGSGGVLDTDTLRKAIAADIAVLDAGDDEDVSAEYIRHVASVVIYRAVAAAAEAASKKVGP